MTVFWYINKEHLLTQHSKAQHRHVLHHLPFLLPHYFVLFFGNSNFSSIVLNTIAMAKEGDFNVHFLYLLNTHKLLKYCSTVINSTTFFILFLAFFSLGYFLSILVCALVLCPASISISFCSFKLPSL